MFECGPLWGDDESRGGGGVGVQAARPPSTGEIKMSDRRQGGVWRRGGGGGKQRRMDDMEGVQVLNKWPGFLSPTWCMSNLSLCSLLWSDPDTRDTSAPQSLLLHVLIKTNVFADTSSLSLAWLIASLLSVNSMSCIPIYSGKINQS